MKNNEIELKPLDQITIHLETKKENEKPIITTKKIVLGFNEIEPLIEKFLLDSKVFKLNEKYELSNSETKTVYQLEILKVTTPNNIQLKERKLIQNLKTHITNQNIEIAQYVSKIYNLENEIKKSQDEFKKIATDFQQKAQTEINKIKQQNSEQAKKEINEIKKYALQDFFEDFLNSLNNLEIAINVGAKSQNSEVVAYTRGFLMLLNKMENTLADYGIQKIYPEPGEMFDANIHQVFELEDQNLVSETIIKVKTPGYKLHDRVIKPALVIVQK